MISHCSTHLFTCALPWPHIQCCDAPSFPSQGLFFEEEKGDDSNPEVVLDSCTCSNHPKTFMGIGVFGLFLQGRRNEKRNNLGVNTGVLM